MAELKNLGPKGRKHLVDVWGAYLPKYGDPPFHAANGGAGAQSGEAVEEEIDEDEEEMEEDETNSTAMEMRRNQVRFFYEDLILDFKNYGTHTLVRGRHNSYTR